MVQDEKNRQNVTTYQIDNKRYTVITRTIDNAQNIDKLYDVICKYIISQINWKLHRGVELWMESIKLQHI